MITQTELILNILNTVTSKASYLKDSACVSELDLIRESIYKTEYSYENILAGILKIDKNIKVSIA